MDKGNLGNWFKRNQLLTIVLAAAVIFASVIYVQKALQKKRFLDKVEQDFAASMSEWQSRRIKALNHIEAPQKSATYTFDNEHKVLVLYDGEDKIELWYNFYGTQNKDNEPLYIATMIAVATYVPDSINYFLLGDSTNYVCVAYARDPKTRKFEQVAYDHVSKDTNECLSDLPELSAKHISGILTIVGLKADFSNANEFR